MFKQIACIAWLCTSAAAFAAESYPSRPIRLIVPFSAGGGADTILPISEKPEDLTIVVAGGPGSHSVFLPVSAYTRSVTQEIVLSE